MLDLLIFVPVAKSPHDLQILNIIFYAFRFLNVLILFPVTTLLEVSIHVSALV